MANGSIDFEMKYSCCSKKRPTALSKVTNGSEKKVAPERSSADFFFSFRSVDFERSIENISKATKFLVRENFSAKCERNFGRFCLLNIERPFVLFELKKFPRQNRRPCRKNRQPNGSFRFRRAQNRSFLLNLRSNLSKIDRKDFLRDRT